MKTKKFSALIFLGLSLALAGGAAPAAAATPLAITGMTMATDSSTQAAIKAVIQKANDEQAQALAQQNDSLMRDTATDAYYQQMAQTNDDLAASGATAIKLTNLQWGAVNVNGTTARVRTLETWTTTYSDGSMDQSRDPNLYTLRLVDGQWKISGDTHPGTGIDQPVPGTQPSSPSGQPAPLGSGESHNWSGYAATGSGFTAVNGTWTIPTVDPNSSSFGSDASWVGIGGVNSRDLIQAGTDETADGSGNVHYEAWIETLPQASHPVSLAVHPGDSVSVSIDQQATGSWSVDLKNNTTGQDYQQNVQYDSSLSSAEWVEEAPSGGRGILPLDNFGSVHFSGATAVENGKTVTAQQANAGPITMIGNAGQPLATPSALGSDGSSFSVSRTQGSAAPTPAPAALPGNGGGFVIIPGLGAVPVPAGF